MYEAYYGLRVNPFRLAPDPKFFYESSCHKRGLAYLRYGLQQGEGIVVVTGVPGTGKSLLVQTIFAELVGQATVVASINNTNLEADDILQAVANSFDVYCRDTTKAALLNALERFLLQKHEQGKRVLLIVDEAQNLPRRSLEELRMLSNFQNGERPLLQIMLLGQQQLRGVLSSPSMEQLTQRVIASCHLKPLDAEETRGYIGHRLRIAGWRGCPSFTGEALGLIHHISRGIPRLINTFCDRLLLAAFLDEKERIDAAHVRGVLQELQHEVNGAWQGINPGAAPFIELAPLSDSGPMTFDKAIATPEPAPSNAEVPVFVDDPLFAAALDGDSGQDVTNVMDEPGNTAVATQTSKGYLPAAAKTDQRVNGEEIEPLPQFDDREPPPLVYKDRDSMMAGRWWFIVGILVLVILVTVLIVMMELGH